MASSNVNSPSELATNELQPEDTPGSTKSVPSTILGVPAIVVPTLVTSASALCGLTAINSAVAYRFEEAVLLVLIAGAFDAIDGHAARRLNCASQFGVELDSLVDFLSFGVAPGMIVYIWALQALPTIGFSVVSLYVLCCAYRLARFNAAALRTSQGKSSYGYFQGVPAPTGAMCALLPLMFSFSAGSSWPQSWSITAPIMVATSLLMVSTVPTISSKMIAKRLGPKTVFSATLLLIGFIWCFPPWSVLVTAIVGYVATVPITFVFTKTGRHHGSLKYPKV